MRIGKLSEATGISRDAIRLYEAKGLLVDVSRPNEFNNYKEYSEDNIKRIGMIISMKKLGMTLNECSDVLEQLTSNNFDAAAQRKFLEEKIKSINQKIAELQGFKSMFQKFLDTPCTEHDIDGGI